MNKEGVSYMDNLELKCAACNKPTDEFAVGELCTSCIEETATYIQDVKNTQESNKELNKLKVVVKEVTKKESILEVETWSGTEILKVTSILFGYTTNDYSSWDITKRNKRDLKQLVENIADLMSKKRVERTSLQVIYESHFN